MQPGTGSGSGYLASTVGVLAIVAAARALRAHRFGPRRIRVAAALGMAFGIAGSVAMIYSMLVVGLAPLGVALPPDPLTLARLVPTSSISPTTGIAAPAQAPVIAKPAATPAASPAVQPAAVPSSPANAAQSAPAPVAPNETPLAAPYPTPTTADAEVQQLQTLATALRSALVAAHPVGSAWPAHLYRRDLTDEQLIDLQAGHTLTTAPPTTTVGYSASADGSEYSFELTGGTFGSIVRYDSLSGVFTSSAG
jgi:hypothetical protein